MYLYPGGHCEKSHNSILVTAKKEVIEETGITNFEAIYISKNKNVPIDIDVHKIPYNARVNMPKHYHFDFRYLFFVDKEYEINVDQKEIGNYKWGDEKQLKSDKNYGKILEKLKKYIP